LALISSLVTSAGAQTTVTFPYPKWFLNSRDSSPANLVFRMYGYEGMARNLFVLTCRMDTSEPITVEMIPPKGLEQRLRRLAPATPKRTAIKILDGSSKSGDAVLFQHPGEYDKIAAFIDLSSDDQFFAFLQLFQYEKLLVRWEQAGFEYLLERTEVYMDLFAEQFRNKFLEAQNEELSYQDVYLKCGRLWGR
jgi:hypothetical protein